MGMRISNRTRNTLLGTRVIQADTWWGRARGFIGRQEPKLGEGILLVSCNAIHTWWMSFDLDVLFLDGRGKVLKVIQSFSPWKWTWRVRGAVYVLEVPAGTIETSGTQVGDELTWQNRPPYTISVLTPQENLDGSKSPSHRSET